MFQYGCNVIKFDRHGYKRRNRLLFISRKHFYVVVEGDKQFKIKHKIPFETILKLEITSERDNFLLIRIPTQLTKDKVIINFFQKYFTCIVLYLNRNFFFFNLLQGDVILEVPNLIEVITKIVSITNNLNLLNVNTIDDGK